MSAFPGGHYKRQAAALNSVSKQSILTASMPPGIQRFSREAIFSMSMSYGQTGSGKTLGLCFRCLEKYHVKVSQFGVNGFKIFWIDLQKAEFACVFQKMTSDHPLYQTLLTIGFQPESYPVEVLRPLVYIRGEPSLLYSQPDIVKPFTISISDLSLTDWIALFPGGLSVGQMNLHHQALKELNNRIRTVTMHDLYVKVQEIIEKGKAGYSSHIDGMETAPTITMTKKVFGAREAQGLLQKYQAIMDTGLLMPEVFKGSAVKTNINVKKMLENQKKITVLYVPQFKDLPHLHMGIINFFLTQINHAKSLNNPDRVQVPISIAIPELRNLCPKHIPQEERYYIEPVRNTILELVSQGAGMGLAIDADSLPPDEEVIIERNGTLERVKIGELAEEHIQKDSVIEGDNVISYTTNQPEVDAPCYDLRDRKAKVKPIRAFVRHSVFHPVFSITTSRGRKVKVTGSHGLFTLKQGILIKTPVETLRRGNYVAVPKRIAFDHDLDNLNLFALLLRQPRKDLEKVYAIGHDFTTLVLNNYDSEIRKQVQNASKRIYEWRKNGSIPLPLIKDLPRLSIPTGTFLGAGHGRRRLYPTHVLIDDDFLWLLGFLIAEGHIVNGDIKIWNKKKELIERSQWTLLSHLNVKTNLKSDGLGYYLEFRAPVLNSIFKAFGISHLSRNKRAPAFVFGLSDTKIKAFLKGLYDGDNAVSSIYDIGWGTTSLALKNDVILLLAKLGEIWYSYPYKPLKENRADVHYIFVSGLKDFSRLGVDVSQRTEKFDKVPVTDLMLTIARKYHLTSYFNRIINIWENATTVRNVQRFIQIIMMKIGFIPELDLLRAILHADIRFERIRKIVKCENQPQFVYDLSVDACQNFVTGDIILTHNTQFFDQIPDEYRTNVTTTFIYDMGEEASEKIREVVRGRYVSNFKEITDDWHLSSLKEPGTFVWLGYQKLRAEIRKNAIPGFWYPRARAGEKETETNFYDLFKRFHPDRIVDIFPLYAFTLEINFEAQTHASEDMTKILQTKAQDEKSLKEEKAVKVKKTQEKILRCLMEIGEETKAPFLPYKQMTAKLLEKIKRSSVQTQRIIKHLASEGFLFIDSREGAKKQKVVLNFDKIKVAIGNCIQQQDKAQ
jgi:intein/homing endonuclease